MYKSIAYMLDVVDMSLVPSHTWLTDGDDSLMLKKSSQIPLNVEKVSKLANHLSTR